MSEDELLLTEEEVQSFIRTGFHIVELRDIPKVHSQIINQTNLWFGKDMFPEVPDPTADSQASGNPANGGDATPSGPRSPRSMLFKRDSQGERSTSPLVLGGGTAVSSQATQICAPLNAQSIMLEALNPGNNIYPAIPQLKHIFEHPDVDKTLRSLLGQGYMFHAYKVCERSVPGQKAEAWHQDSYFGYQDITRSHGLEWITLSYFPQDVSSEMGPLEILPGSQYFSLMLHRSQIGWTSTIHDDNEDEKVHADSSEHKRGDGAHVSVHLRRRSTATTVVMVEKERTAPLSTEIHEEPITIICKGGTVVFTHFDLWNRFTSNTSPHVRYCFKFHFVRRKPPGSSRPCPFPSKWNPSYDADSNAKPHILVVCSEVAELGKGGEFSQIYENAARCLKEIPTDFFINLSSSKDLAFRTKNCSSIARQVLSNTRGAHPALFKDLSTEILDDIMTRIAARIESSVSILHKRVYRKLMQYKNRSPAWLSIWDRLIDNHEFANRDIENVDELVNVLTSPLDDIEIGIARRVECAYHLANHGESGISILLGALRSQFPVNFAAMYALASIRKNDLTILLSERLVHMKAAEFQHLVWQIAFILGRMGFVSKEVLDFLSSYSNDSDSWVRREVVEALGWLLALDRVTEVECKDFVALFSQSCRDSVELVRITSFLAIARIGNKISQHLLAELTLGLSDKNRYVQDLAVTCLSDWIPTETGSNTALRETVQSLLAHLRSNRWCSLTNNSRRF
jgi:hypothetical protein